MSLSLPIRALAGGALATALLWVSGPAAHAAEPAKRAVLRLVVVLDGLRPDSITAEDTPTLYRLRTEGVWFENSHAVFPTVTRVNAASLGTGTYPARHGIMGNSIYVPAVDPLKAFSNDDAVKLLRLDEVTGGQMTSATGIANLLERGGRKMVVVSSGSTGSAILLAPGAARGSGTVINGDFSPGTTVAYPAAVSEAVKQRFGVAPSKGGATDRYDASVDWSMNVLREYVLPELKPAVVFTWMTEPDHIQHGLGAGAAASREAIRNDDRNLGLLLAKLEALGLRDQTDIIVVSDHGFAQTVGQVNVERALVEVGLMPAGESAEVVMASSGQAVALHVKERDPGRITAIAEFLQRQPWCGVVFTAARPGGSTGHEGMVPGTFSLEIARLGGHERSPDIVFTFPWTSEPNAHGVPGTEFNQVSGSAVTGPVQTPTANHGGIGPWTVRNTMLAWGPSFKRRTTVRTPSSNVDVAPTLLHLLGMGDATERMDGRPLLEALANGPDVEQIAVRVDTLRVQHGAYRAVLQLSEVSGKRYIDKAWREP